MAQTTLADGMKIVPSSWYKNVIASLNFHYNYSEPKCETCGELLSQSEQFNSVSWTGDSKRRESMSSNNLTRWEEFARTALAELIRKVPYVDTKVTDPRADDKIIKIIHDAMARSAASYADSMEAECRNREGE